FFPPMPLLHAACRAALQSRVLARKVARCFPEYGCATAPRSLDGDAAGAIEPSTTTRRGRPTMATGRRQFRHAIEPQHPPKLTLQSELTPWLLVAATATNSPCQNPVGPRHMGWAPTTNSQGTSLGGR